MSHLNVIIRFEPATAESPALAIVKCASGFFSCISPEELWSTLNRFASGHAEIHSIGPGRGLRPETTPTPARVLLEASPRPEPKRYTARGTPIVLADDIELDL